VRDSKREQKAQKQCSMQCHFFTICLYIYVMVAILDLRPTHHIFTICLYMYVMATIFDLRPTHQIFTICLYMYVMAAILDL